MTPPPPCVAQRRDGYNDAALPALKGRATFNRRSAAEQLRRGQSPLFQGSEGAVMTAQTNESQPQRPCHLQPSNSQENLGIVKQPVNQARRDLLTSTLWQSMIFRNSVFP